MGRLFEKVRFKNFRGFMDLELDGIQPFTLISGKNNVGKTSILEGIFLYHDHTDVNCFLQINSSRGLFATISPQMWESLFYNKDMKEKMQIEVKDAGKQATLIYSRDDAFVPINTENVPPEQMTHLVSSASMAYTLKYKFIQEDYSEEGHFTASPMAGVLRNIETSLQENQIKPMGYAQYIGPRFYANDSEITDWYGQLELEGKKQDIIKGLRLIDKRISDISTITTGGVGQLYVKIAGQMIPLRLSGDGMYRLLYLLMTVMVHPNALILIDEIENGFHYSVYSKVWEVLMKAGKMNRCQIIATTHSYEFIVSCREALQKAEAEDDFCLYRIQCEDGIGRSFRYSTEMLDTALENQMEVR